MENMANVATRVVMVTTRGFLTSGIIAAMMFLFDWRMGLITLTGLVLFFAVNAAMQRAEQTLPGGSSMPMSALCPRCWNMCRASPRSRIST